MSEWNHLRFELREGRVGLLTLSRPRQLNALNGALLAELDQLFDLLVGAEEPLRALVLCGDGPRAFAAGADIAEMAGYGPEQAEEMAARGQQILGRLESFPWPTIAAVNGFALGGGCELAMCCDFILASPTATFGQPEVKLGVIPGFGGTQRLVRRVGPQRALELMMTGRNIGAEEALAIGLVLRVVQEDVVEGALSLANQISANAPRAVAAVKAAWREADRDTLQNGLSGEARLFGACFSTADQKEGMAAFLARRPPTFTGT